MKYGELMQALEFIIGPIDWEVVNLWARNEQYKKRFFFWTVEQNFEVLQPWHSGMITIQVGGKTIDMWKKNRVNSQ